MNTSSISLKQLSQDTVKIITNSYMIMLHADIEGFIHIDSIRVLDWRRLFTILQPHGVIGQTWKRRSTTESVVEGYAEDYEVGDSSDMYSSALKFNKFNRSETSVSSSMYKGQTSKERQSLYKRQ